MTADGSRPALACRRPLRRRPGVGDLRAQQGSRRRARRRPASRSTRRLRRAPPPSSSTWSGRLDADDSIDGILVQLPLPAHDRRPGRDRVHLAGARTPTASIPTTSAVSPRATPGRSPRARRSDAWSCSAAAVMHAARQPRRGHRTQRDRRAPTRAHAHQRRCHGDDLPLEDPGSRGDLPRGGHPGGRDRPAAHGRRVVRQAGGLRHRRRNDPGGRRRGGRRGPGHRSNPLRAGSPRCRAASGR